MVENTNENSEITFDDNDLGFDEMDLIEVDVESNDDKARTSTPARNLSYLEIYKMTPKFEGNPYGVFEDKLKFLKWVITTPYLREAASYFKTAIDNINNYQFSYVQSLRTPYFPEVFFSDEGGRHKYEKPFEISLKNDIQLTMEFLKNIDYRDNTRRIKSVTKRTGTKTIPNNYYYREFVLALNKTVLNYFKDVNGKITVESRIQETGNLMRRHAKKIMHRLCPLEESQQLLDKIKQHRIWAEQQIGIRENPSSYALNNLLLLSNGEEGISLDLKTSERQYKAMEKLRNKDQKYLVKLCEYCGSPMKYPLMITGDHHEQFAWELYNISFNEEKEYKSYTVMENGLEVVKHKMLCKHCLKYKWDEEKIRKLIKQLFPSESDEKKCFEIPLEKFCSKFRTNGKVPLVEENGLKVINYPLIRSELRRIFARKGKSIRVKEGIVRIQ